MYPCPKKNKNINYKNYYIWVLEDFSFEIVVWENNDVLYWKFHFSFLSSILKNGIPYFYYTVYVYIYNGSTLLSS